MKTAKLLSISALKTENRTKDSKKARQFYVAEFADSNPFAQTTVKRVIWEQHTNEAGTEVSFKGADHSVVSKLVGQSIPCEIMSVEVQPYAIGDRIVTTCTIAKFPSESLTKAVRAAGKKLPASVEAVAEVSALAEAEAIN